MGERIYNLTILKSRRQELRNNATEAEILLWEKLRKKQLGVKFCRQYGAGGYILDFYCAKKKMAIELDGLHHENDEEIQEYDEERTEFLKSLGISVFRFKNSDVLQDINGVYKKISDFISK